MSSAMRKRTLQEWPFPEERMMEIVNENLFERDAEIFKLRFYGTDDEGPLSSRQIAVRLDIHRATVDRAIQQLLPTVGAAVEVVIGLEKRKSGGVADAYMLERFDVVKAYGHKAFATTDVTPLSAIGPDINRINRGIRARIEFIEHAEEAARKAERSENS